MAMLLVCAVDLGKRYGKVWGLRSATFSFRKGEVGVLLGPNGAGKTTTVKILATLLKPSKGKATVLGYDVVRDYKRIRKLISYMPQEGAVDRNWTPLEAVMWFLVARGWSLGDAKQEAKAWLERLGLWDRRNDVCWKLSGGQQRRVLVAMCLAASSELIMLDEPTVGLDAESRYEVWKVLRSTVREGATVLMTTHNMEEAEMLADSVVLLREGTVAAQGSPKELLAKLPYDYKIVVENSGLEALPYKTLNVGDRSVVYVREDELEQLVAELSAKVKVFSVKPVGLEDAYLYLTGGGTRDAG